MAKSSSRQAKNKAGVLLGVTASIAAYKSCELVRLLQKDGFSVRVVMSRDAKWFVTPLTMETLTGKKVYSEMFQPPEQRDPEHISLADEADIILVAPATADCISKVASGICDDMLTCVICASKAPVVFAPAMNDSMYTNPIIQDKIAYLKDKGYVFIDPVVGDLVCGRKGVGHLAPLEDIVKQVKRSL